MSNLALSRQLQVTAEHPCAEIRPQLELVQPLQATQRANAFHIAIHYLFTTLTATITVLLLNWLAPTGAQRAPALAALAAAASVFLFATLPLARHAWQRIVGAMIAVNVLILALAAQWEPTTAGPSLLCLSAGSLFMLFASSEHDLNTPGIFLFSSILAAGLLFTLPRFF